MTTQTKIDNWFKNAVGRGMNLDGMYGYQCKDVIDDYSLALFGDWVNTIRPGNAYLVFNNANSTYFTKIANKPNSPGLIPQRGDIICWPKGTNDKYGHIAVVESADANGVVVIQQDGLQKTKPAHRLRRSYWRLGVVTQGWLRPKLSPVITTRTETKKEALSFKTIHIDDHELPLGETQVTRKGANGEQTFTWTITLTDGKETARKLTSSVQTKEPVDELVSVGQYVELPVEPAPEPPPPELPQLPETPRIVKQIIQSIINFIKKLIGRK